VYTEYVMWLLYETVAFNVARLWSVYRRVHSIELATRCKQLYFVSWLYNNPRSNLSEAQKLNAIIMLPEESVLCSHDYG